MTDDLKESFSGFMPAIKNINISSEISMMDSNGELINAHAVAIIVSDGTEYIFSINNHDLMRLFFLIAKVAN